MKKILIVFLLAGVMVSCGTTKMERQTTKTLQGDWSLTDISYPGSDGFVDVTMFNDANVNCLLNSDWHFIANNNHGTYQLFKSDCEPGIRRFRWNVIENSDNGKFYFTLKPIQGKENARAVDSGYRMELVRLNATQMIWEESVVYNGDTFLIRLNFSKN